MGKIVVSITKKRQSTEAYSSDGVGVEYTSDEVEISNSADFQNRVAGLLAECQQAVDAELDRIAQPSPRAAGTKRSDLWTGQSGGNGGRQQQRADAGQRSGGNGDGSGVITAKQAKYVVELGAKRGMPNQVDIEGWIRSELGIERGLYELTRTEASRCIDALREQGAKR